MLCFDGKNIERQWELIANIFNWETIYCCFMLTVKSIVQNPPKLNSPKYVLSRIFKMIFSIFSWFPFPIIVFASYSKSCQTVEGISMIRHFHEFFKSNFWRDFEIAIWASIRINCHHLQLRNNLLLTVKSIVKTRQN